MGFSSLGDFRRQQIAAAAGCHPNTDAGLALSGEQFVAQQRFWGIEPLSPAAFEKVSQICRLHAEQATDAANAFEIGFAPIRNALKLVGGTGSVSAKTRDAELHVDTKKKSVYVHFPALPPHQVTPELSAQYSHQIAANAKNDVQFLSGVTYDTWLTLYKAINHRAELSSQTDKRIAELPFARVDLRFSKGGPLPATMRTEEYLRNALSDAPLSPLLNRIRDAFVSSQAGVGFSVMSSAISDIFSAARIDFRVTNSGSRSRALAAAAPLFANLGGLHETMRVGLFQTLSALAWTRVPAAPYKSFQSWAELTPEKFLDAAQTELKRISHA